MVEHTEGEKRNSLSQVLDQIRSMFRDAGIESWAYEAWALLEWKLSISRADYYMDPQRLLAPDEEALLLRTARSRAGRRPLQYMMGECEFMGFPFMVDERVLIPRQDTELLVETALDRIACLAASRKPDQRLVRVLDMCTGSGAIGISVKMLCPEADVTISDISKDALTVAGANWDRLRKEGLKSSGSHECFEKGFHILQSNLFENIRGRFDFILSNPPYIPTEVIGELMPEVRDHEPRLALDGEKDGLAFYRKITGQAGHFLKEGGFLLMEIGADQAKAVMEMMRERGFEQVRVHRDLAGLDRLLSGSIGNKNME